MNRLDPARLPSPELLFVDGSVLRPELHADALSAHARDLGDELWQEFETAPV